MAHYDVERKRGDDMKEPRPGAVMAYSESYVASSEQVVSYGLHDQFWPRQTHTNGSPRKTLHAANSPREEELDLECRDGVCYPKPKHGNGYPAGNHQASNTPNTYATHAYYETQPYALPAPRDSSPVSQWTPFATSSPRKAKPDSSEAQRQRRYGPAIDSETAARKYGGVFLK